MMIAELFLLAWILETTLAGGRLNRGDFRIWQMRRFHVEVRGVASILSKNFRSPPGCDAESTTSSNYIGPI